jgi:hypothetical protein
MYSWRYQRIANITFALVGTLRVQAIYFIDFEKYFAYATLCDLVANLASVQFLLLFSSVRESSRLHVCAYEVIVIYFNMARLESVIIRFYSLNLQMRDSYGLFWKVYWYLRCGVPLYALISLIMFPLTVHTIDGADSNINRHIVPYLKKLPLKCLV